MDKFVFATKDQMGKAAAEAGAGVIKKAIESKDYANIIVATGASQFEMLSNLVKFEDIDWSKVKMFHLDEYIGLSIEHPASFRKYLKERFVNPIGNLKQVNLVNGEANDPEEECKRLGEIISENEIDVAFVGIGENGHLAFNDPPADFETENAYLVVDLDEKCRMQQLGEGWFGSIDEVPTKAISMGIKQILKSGCIIVTVPDERKAEAVKGSVEGEVSNFCPASILQTHPNCKIFLDEAAASLLI